MTCSTSSIPRALAAFVAGFAFAARLLAARLLAARLLAARLLAARLLAARLLAARLLAARLLAARLLAARLLAARFGFAAARFGFAARRFALAFGFAMAPIYSATGVRMRASAEHRTMFAASDLVALASERRLRELRSFGQASSAAY